MQSLKVEVMSTRREHRRSNGLVPTAVRINGKMARLSLRTSWCPMFLYNGLVIKLDDYIKDDGYSDGVRKQVSDSLKLWNSRICKSPDRIYFQAPVANGYTFPDKKGNCGGIRWMAQEFIRKRNRLSKKNAKEIKRVIEKFGILDVFSAHPIRNCATRYDGAPVIYDWGINCGCLDALWYEY